MLMALFKGKRHKFDHHCANINQCFLFLLFALEFACYLTRLLEHSRSRVGVQSVVFALLRRPSVCEEFRKLRQLLHRKFRFKIELYR